MPAPAFGGAVAERATTAQGQTRTRIKKRPVRRCSGSGLSHVSTRPTRSFGTAVQWLPYREIAPAPRCRSSFVPLCPSHRGNGGSINPSPGPLCLFRGTKSERCGGGWDVEEEEDMARALARRSTVQCFRCLGFRLPAKGSCPVAACIPLYPCCPPCHKTRRPLAVSSYSSSIHSACNIAYIS